MKKFLLILIMMPVLCFSQNKIAYSEVVQTDSVSKQTLYGRGLTFFANNFKNANNVIQLKDESECHIIGKSNIEYQGVDQFYSGHINFTVELTFKDGRFKYDIKDFYHQGERITVGDITDSAEAQFKAFGSSKAFRNREWNNLKTVVQTLSENLIKQMNETIANPAKQDNW